MYMWSRPYLGFECNFRFFANALFWASGHNLGLKHPANSCKGVAFAAGAQGKPMHCRAMIWAENLTFFSKYWFVTRFFITRNIAAATTVVPFCFQGHLWGGFPSSINFYGLLIQLLGYCFKISYCLLGFCICRSLLFL